MILVDAQMGRIKRYSTSKKTHDAREIDPRTPEIASWTVRSSISELLMVQIGVRSSELLVHQHVVRDVMRKYLEVPKVR